ncbi:camphor resistance protein CrcB [Listeria fleischmannii 1991]|uniref:Fluoride-specific ion channel FluC n=2 Tax=Listeria fleischmannii TaxID=1069827 RepID=A0A2X3GVD1_9LIST|nr:CrcB family protein [Listeria fleischmannii]EMG27476.1 camphor resistance protein CrcB [Listeria fleischmannii subsp. fleischmannii LU2006-1]KMT59710.1 camphor resistance protein CrcB [Listeria fleischmannii 1991]SQC72318.1 camphor resistance protein CrcB [Listeria fleischmannii subsp. fleischmannii]
MYFLYVGIFSALGGMTRYGVGLLLTGYTFPVATLVVNLVGCFLLAVVTQVVAANPKVPKELVAGMGTGFVGAFTTFSSFSVENIELLQAGQIGVAGLYIGISLIGGLAFAKLGYIFSAKWVGHRA